MSVHGTRLNWSRFGSWLDCFEFWDVVWHLRVVAWLIMGITLGYVSGTEKSRTITRK